MDPGFLSSPRGFLWYPAEEVAVVGSRGLVDIPLGWGGVVDMVAGMLGGGRSREKLRPAHVQVEADGEHPGLRMKVSDGC